ncbi:hypothetical protein JCM30760_06360 [Thiomicrorhabdus hydrogeniphila]
MNTSHNPIFRFTLTAILALASLAISPFAMSETNSTLPDEQQPVNIIADSLLASEKTGKSVYTGNVVITQGSLTLKGDKVNISHPKNQLTRVIATGNPATFKRYSQVDQAWLKGKAQKIEYNVLNKTVLLIGNALVEQPGKHLISGPELFYNIDKQTLQAQSTKTEKKRISVTLNPATTDKKNAVKDKTTNDTKNTPTQQPPSTEAQAQ